VRKIIGEELFSNAGHSIENGLIELDDTGKILRVLSPADAEYSTEDAEYYQGWVIPGFINAHCHLELSHLKAKIKPHTGLDGFISELAAINTDFSDCVRAATDTEKQMKQAGIVGVIDIANTDRCFKLKAESNLRYFTMVERYGIRSDAAAEAFNSGIKLVETARKLGLRVNLSPHAPYSLSDALQKIIKEALEKENEPLYSIHFMESEAETELFELGAGAIAQRLKKWNLLKNDFPYSGQRPAQFVLQGLPENAKVALVHNTFIEEHDLQIFQDNKSSVWFVLCPKANLYIENRLPDVNKIRAFTSQIAVGTDSLASNEAIDMVAELYEIQEAFPEVTSSELICWATLEGARLMGLNHELGSIEPGKHPGLVQIYPVDKLSKKLIKNSKSYLI
jgi:cytosine/adenosine deaminase-related metal-dependent hydrolase